MPDDPAAYWAAIHAAINPKGRYTLDGAEQGQVLWLSPDGRVTVLRAIATQATVLDFMNNMSALESELSLLRPRIRIEFIRESIYGEPQLGPEA